MITHYKPPVGRSCTHSSYLMECSDFDELATRAGTCCEICGVSEEATPHGTLYIDHDYEYGRWAVRGLLCSRCNPMLERGRIPGVLLNHYIANPWWKQKLARFGLDGNLLPEPPVGTWVRAPGVRIWLRTKSGWEPPARRTGNGRGDWRGKTLSWSNLHYHFGPHNLSVDPKVHGLASRLKRTSPCVDAEAVMAALQYGLRQVDVAKLAGCADGTVHGIARRARLPLKRAVS